MAFTAGISNIQVIYPYRLIIGSLVIPAAQIAAGVTISVDAGQSVKLLDGNTYETSEKVRATAEISDLSSADRLTLAGLANTSQIITLRIDSTQFYRFLRFTAIVMTGKKIQAGQHTKYMIEMEIEKANADEVLTYDIEEDLG